MPQTRRRKKILRLPKKFNLPKAQPLLNQAKQYISKIYLDIRKFKACYCEDVELILDLLPSIGRWEEAEPILLKKASLYDLGEYARLYIKGRWELAEERLKRDTLAFVTYACGIECAIPELEEELLTYRGTNWESYIRRYCMGALGRRWKAAEAILLVEGTTRELLAYSNDVVKRFTGGPWKEAKERLTNEANLTELKWYRGKKC